MPVPHNSDCGPLWFRQRTIGRARKRTMRTSPDLMKRLNLEASLSGHDSCVNCLQWNSVGDRLASGSDDSSIIIWDTFRAVKQKVVWPGHNGIIFSVKFMPSSNDSLLASCGNDSQVIVTNARNSENILVCDNCHTDRVKRLAVHPSEPNLIWSAAEDGLIMQYDTRQSHTCNLPGKALIDLNFTEGSLEAKCIAVNPLRSEMLAVGTNDIYNRLFDRRYLTRDASISCTAYLTPGHLPQTNNRSNRIQSYGTTYLSFNSTGSQLLASVHAEQIYLYNTYEPSHGYRSFEASIKPLLLGASVNERPHPFGTNQGIATSDEGPSFKKTRPDLTKYNLNDDLWLGSFCKIDARTSCRLVTELNNTLARGPESPDIYRARAVGLMNRAWRGDSYQALRDCCRSLALEPLNFKTIRCLASALVKLGYRDSCLGLLEIIELLLEQNSNDETLLRTQEILESYKRAPSPTSSINDEEMMCSRENEPVRFDVLMQHLTGVRSFTTNLIQARKKAVKTFDFCERFCGHSNMNTDIKEANFFGDDDEFIVGGSDDGAFYIWDKNTTNVLKAVHADDNIVNCVQPHPNISMLATSGIDSSVKLWSLSGKVCRDVKNIEEYSIWNNEYISTDPLDAMINMLRAPENRHRSADLPN